MKITSSSEPTKKVLIVYADGETRQVTLEGTKPVTIKLPASAMTGTMRLSVQIVVWIYDLIDD